MESSKLDGVSMVFPNVACNTELNEEPPVAPLPYGGSPSEDVRSKHDPQEASLPIGAVDHAKSSLPIGAVDHATSLPIGAVDHATFKATMRRGSRKYFCSICNDIKTGCYADYLRHNRMHTGEKNFVCPVCPYTCKYKLSLMKHVKERHHMQV